MIVSGNINVYGQTPTMNSVTAATGYQGGQAQQGEENDTAQENASNAAVSSRVLTESDGSTIMQYTTLSPGGAIMRKNVTLHEADAFTADPMNPQPMLRRRSNAFEQMMQIF